MGIRLGLVALLVTVLVAVAAPWAGSAAAAGRCDVACVTVDDAGAPVPCITDPACAGSTTTGVALAGLAVVLVAAAAPQPTRPLLGIVPAAPPPAWGRGDPRRLLRPQQPQPSS